jgi:aromatic ring hydroxylase
MGCKYGPDEECPAKKTVKDMTYDELKMYLAQKYEVAPDKSSKVFRLSWDYGHSAGHHEVEYYYTELAELVR